MGIPVNVSLETEHDFLVAWQATAPQLRGWLTRRDAYAHLADDILQETALRAWSLRDQFVGRGSPRGWLFRIGQRIAHKTHRIHHGDTVVAAQLDSEGWEAVEDSAERTDSKSYFEGNS